MNELGTSFIEAGSDDAEPQSQQNSLIAEVEPVDLQSVSQPSVTVSCTVHGMNCFQPITCTVVLVIRNMTLRCICTGHGKCWSFKLEITGLVSPHQTKQTKGPQKS